jgi:hypothetical protein
MEYKKLDIVYILGTGSIWNDNEIRYSLRSVQKFFPNHGHVYVVGENLDWFNTQHITHIPAIDPYINKSANGIHKIQVACQTEEISDPFILMNDDFIFAEPTEEIEVFHKGTLDYNLQKHPSKNGYYFENMVNTKVILYEQGIENPIDYSIHYPIILDKVKTLKSINVGLASKKPFLLRTLYGNLWNIGGKETMDFKANKLSEFVFQKARRANLISMSDLVVGYEEVQKWFKLTFPLVSKFENDEGRGLTSKPRKNVMRVYATVDFNYNGTTIHMGTIIPDRIAEAICGNPKFNSKWRQA